MLALGASLGIALLALSPLAAAQADGAKRNPTGKIYVASLTGDSQIATSDKVEALAVKASFRAQGTRIETKPHGNVSMVFSNGTGIFLDQDTQVDVKRFTQEPFVASRTDLESEPSISHTEAYVERGVLAVSTGQLAAGTTMTYATPLGAINLHGGKVVIEVLPDEVKISLLEGEGTVYGGDLDLGGHVIHTGEQAIIRPGPPDRANGVTIDRIPENEKHGIEDRAAMAYAARKTVFFETNESGEINALPVVEASVPVQATVSPSRLPR